MSPTAEQEILSGLRQLQGGFDVLRTQLFGDVEGEGKGGRIPAIEVRLDGHDSRLNTHSTRISNLETVRSKADGIVTFLLKVGALLASLAVAYKQLHG